MRDRLAPWLHAAGVTAAAALAYVLAPEADRGAIVTAVVAGATTGLGRFLRARPVERITGSRRRIVVLQKHVHRAIHDAVNGLASLKAEIDMAIDEAFADTDHDLSKEK